ncbi:Holliday junction ATP-dependent DNA helicase RuvA [Frankliniella fusca]|uniref:Holliday junction ATP-dependent DNA helicase RuvA n=1 Tax=Frankliniella fusca TaxID=407009 RepID=A0AAE1GZA2_9NEOP|nr:Holliday junction ATP-dependent DNA helicase RuvA [Frankliniella fusca]
MAESEEMDKLFEEAVREGEEGEGAAVAAAFIDALEAEQVEAVDALTMLHDGVPAPVSPLPLSPPAAPEGNAADGAAPDHLSGQPSGGSRAISGVPRRSSSAATQGVSS